MAVVNVIPETLAAVLATPEIAAAWANDNGAWIKTLIDGHKDWLNSEGIAVYQAAYDGYLESVDLRDKSRGDDVNHKLQVNYAALIVDTCVDYMMGKPITWTFEDPDKLATEAQLAEYRKALLGLLHTEDGQRVLSELLRQGSIACYSAIISWVDENGKIDYEEYPVQEIIPVYDVRGHLRLVLRYYPWETVTYLDGRAIKKQLTRVEVYDEKYVTFYVSNETGDAYELDDEETETGNPVQHFAARIPVTIFVNGTPARYESRQRKSGTSDLGNGVLTLLENYAHCMSDKANTVDRVLDQYLLLKGVNLGETPEKAEREVLAMRKARAIALSSTESDASFIAPDQEDQAVENHLKRVKDTFHETTGTPQLNELAGATATEIKMRYGGLDIKAGKKELYFAAAVKNLVAVLTDMLNAARLKAAGVDDVYEYLANPGNGKVKLYSASWVQATINRNLPQNFKEISEIVKNLAGIVPDSYLYELLWFVEDPVAALAEMKAQKEAESKLTAQQGLAAMGLGGSYSSTE